MSHAEWLRALAKIIESGQPLCPLDGDNCQMARDSIALRLRTISSNLDLIGEKYAAGDLR